MTKKLVGWPGHFLALSVGIIWAFGFAPFNIWPLTGLSLLGFFFSLQSLTRRQALWRALWYGIGFYGVGVSWVYVSIHQYGSAPIALAVFLTSLFVIFLSFLFFAPLGWTYVWLTQRFKASTLGSRLVLFGLLWLVFEWLKTWFLTGFPWLLLGYAYIDTPLANWSPVIGSLGLSALVLASWLGLTWLTIQRKQCTSKLWQCVLACTTLLWVAGALLSNQQWTDNAQTKTLTVSAVQANIPQQLKWNKEYAHTTLATYRLLSKDHWKSDLIIWPENAIPLVYPLQAKSFVDMFAEEANKYQNTLITGLPFMNQKVIDGQPYRTFYNGIIAAGNGSGSYHKQKLVPFGEYVPLEDLLRGLIKFFNLPMSSFSSGDSNQPHLIADQTKIAAFICYEIVYGDFVAKQAQQSNLLITISNDSWFGASIGPHQHFQMARMRALETGRYLIRATNDGISAIINDQGDVITQLPQFQADVLTGKVQTKQGNTPYMIWQSYPLLLMIGFILAVFGWNARQKQSLAMEQTSTP